MSPTIYPWFFADDEWWRIALHDETTGDGVDSIAKSGDAALTGDVTLSAGTNVTLTQVGQDISIASTGGAPSGAAGGALDGTYPNPGIAASVAGAGLAETTNVLSVNVDASTIEINSDTLRVKADGITANEIAAGAVGSSEIASTAVTPATYGDATHVAAFTVDADGRLTSASNVLITGGGGSVATDTLFDAKGDLAVGTGADTAAKLTVGSNNQVPVADSSQTTGIRWGGIDGGSA